MEVSVSILFRKMKGLPLSDEEDQAFEEWYAECEEHRLYWKRFRQQQEKIEERRCGCSGRMDAFGEGEA